MIEQITNRYNSRFQRYVDIRFSWGKLWSKSVKVICETDPHILQKHETMRAETMVDIWWIDIAQLTPILWWCKYLHNFVPVGIVPKGLSLSVTWQNRLTTLCSVGNKQKLGPRSVMVQYPDSSQQEKSKRPVSYFSREPITTRRHLCVSNPLIPPSGGVCTREPH